MTPSKAACIRSRSICSGIVPVHISAYRGRRFRLNVIATLMTGVHALECINLAGFGPWHCRNWRQAGVAMKAQDAALPAGLMILLQRCDAFSTGAI